MSIVSSLASSLYFPLLSLESLGNQVDHKYKKLNEWYKKCDSFRPWLNSSEKKLNEVSSRSEDSLSAKKETLTLVQVFCSRTLFCSLCFNKNI